MIPQKLLEHLDVAARVLRRHPCALIVDVDGTISAIAATPDAATVDPRCREALRDLVGRLDLVAAVSGRAAVVVRQMVGLDGMRYVGNHGLERWQDGRTVLAPAALAYRPLVAAALAEAQARLALPELLFEDKGVVAAIHYRLSPAPDAARAAILAVARDIANAAGLVVAEGKRVVELRPSVAHDKGTAVADLVAECGLRGVWYLGDDRTDVAAFRALRRLRRAGACAGLSIAVLGAETPAAVLRAADYAVAGVDGVAEVLEWLVQSPATSGNTWID